MSRIARRGIVAAFILLLISGIVPSLAQPDEPGIYNPTASAQTAPQESLTIADVSITGTEDENATMTLAALAPTKMGRVQITAESGFGVADAPLVNSLTIAGVVYPVDWVQATADRLTIEADTEVDLQPGTEILVQWSKEEEVLPPVDSYRAVMEEVPGLDSEALPAGDGVPVEGDGAGRVDLRSRAAVLDPSVMDRAAVAQGDPFSRARYDEIPVNNGRHNTCRKSGNSLKVKRWWEPGTHEAVDLVQVKLPNQGNIDLSASAVELSFGSNPEKEWGRIRLQNGTD